MCLDTFHLFRWQILFFFCYYNQETPSIHFIFLIFEVLFCQCTCQKLSVVLEVAVSIILSVFNRPVLQQ